MRARGGIIGASTAPTTTSAGGIWSLREAEFYTRSVAWPALPGLPTNVAGGAGNNAVALTWTAPAQTGGSAITDYSVQYSSDSGATWATFSHSVSTSTTISVTGLTNGTAYLFRVAAVTVVGTGGYATSASVTPAGAVIALSYTAGSWSGNGSSTSPFVSSSTFTTSGSAATLPFSFTASADCEVTVTFNHTTYNDDSVGQDVNYAINGTVVVNLWNHFVPPIYQSYNTLTQTRVISLLSGQVLTVVVKAGGNQDTYTNVSVSAVTPRASNAEFMLVSVSGNNPFTPLPITSLGGTITGAGTAADKFTFPTPLNYGYVQYGSGALMIRTLRACTVNYSCGVANVADDNGVNLYSYKIRQSLGNETGNFTYLAYDAITGAAAITEGTTGTRSFTATANTLYRLTQYGYPGNNVTDLKVWTT